MIYNTTLTQQPNRSNFTQYVITNSLHFSMCNYGKQERNHEEFRTEREPFVSRNSFVSILFRECSPRYVRKGISRKGKRASVVSVFRHSDSVTRIEFSLSIRFLYFSPSRIFVPFHCDQLLHHLRDHDGGQTIHNDDCAFRILVTRS